MNRKELGVSIKKAGITLACLSFLLILVSCPALLLNIWAPIVAGVITGWLGLLIGLIGLFIANYDSNV